MYEQARALARDTAIDTIDAVQAWHLSYPVTPFPLGRGEIRRRDYTLLRITTAAGNTGVAYGMARNAPVTQVITHMIAPSIVGKSLTLNTAADEIRAGLGLHYREGLVARAASLVDIALWDLAAQRLNAPVWALLGNRGPTSAPVSLVAGYQISGETDDSFVERVSRSVADGYRSIKLAAMPKNPSGFVKRLNQLRESVGPDVELIVDLDGSWRDLDQAVATAALWTPAKLGWIEDALPADEPQAIRKLHRELRTPLAIGDEVTSAPLLHGLIERRLVDIIRIDATCAGGFTGFTELRNRAVEYGVGISTHAYPQIHQHTVFGFKGAAKIETFEADSIFEASHRFAAPLSTFRDPATGERRVQAPTEPGLGLRIDWDSVDAHTLTKTTLTSQGAFA